VKPCTSCESGPGYTGPDSCTRTRTHTHVRVVRERARRGREVGREGGRESCLRVLTRLWDSYSRVRTKPLWACTSPCVAQVPDLYAPGRRAPARARRTRRLCAPRERRASVSRFARPRVHLHEAAGIGPAAPPGCLHFTACTFCALYTRPRIRGRRNRSRRPRKMHAHVHACTFACNFVRGRRPCEMHAHACILRGRCISSRYAAGLPARMSRSEGPPGSAALEDAWANEVSWPGARPRWISGAPAGLAEKLG
jgi:hypothetical protein